ncbi:MAG TPA: hypothetical protein VKT77_13195 [Chthonomonadaceae bacterium]|nr:hypothetical protein [Chthonomonadaceae bacterium]
MILTAADSPIRLAMLDQAGQVISEIEAQIVHLDESCALISLDNPDPSVSLNWGTPVRFEIDVNGQRFEMTGTVVTPRDTNDGSPGAAGILDSGPAWELHVRIWDCKLCDQRRIAPRRRIGFPVHLYEAHDRPNSGDGHTAAPILARCVDIGAGGIRVRTQRLAHVPSRMRLEFCLPASERDGGAESAHRFILAGRVIRALPQGRYGDHMDIAFCFEGLSVRDGMALHTLLA